MFWCLSQSAAWQCSSQYRVIWQASQELNLSLSLPQDAHLGVHVISKSGFSDISMSWDWLQELSLAMVSFLVSFMTSLSSLLFLSFSSRVTAFRFPSFSTLTCSRDCRTFLLISVKSSSVLLLSLIVSWSNFSCSALNFFRSSLLSAVTVILTCSSTLSRNEAWSCATFSFSRTSNPWILNTFSAIISPNFSGRVSLCLLNSFKLYLCRWLVFQRVQKLCHRRSPLSQGEFM